MILCSKCYENIENGHKCSCGESSVKSVIDDNIKDPIGFLKFLNKESDGVPCCSDPKISSVLSYRDKQSDESFNLYYCNSCHKFAIVSSIISKNMIDASPEEGYNYDEEE